MLQYIEAVFFLTYHIFQLEISRHSKNCIKYSKESQIKKKKLVKIVSSDKRQNHIWYTFSSCLVITDFKMIPKVVCLLIFLKILISYLIFSDERYIFDENCTFSTFRWVSIISAKVNHSINFNKHFTFHYSLYFL